jgi:hypothetical protein
LRWDDFAWYQPSARTAVSPPQEQAVPGAQELVDRAQRLIDMPRPTGGYSLTWYVEALHVGDATAIAMAALRLYPSS